MQNQVCGEPAYLDKFMFTYFYNCIGMYTCWEKFSGCILLKGIQFILILCINSSQINFSTKLKVKLWDLNEGYLSASSSGETTIWSQKKKSLWQARCTYCRKIANRGIPFHELGCTVKHRATIRVLSYWMWLITPASAAQKYSCYQLSVGGKTQQLFKLE